MARPRGKIEITCQNPDCKYYMREEGKRRRGRKDRMTGNPKRIFQTGFTGLTG